MSANNKPKGPSLYDPDMWRKAGIDPVTGFPIKMGSWDSKLKTDTKILLRIKDEQDAVNRFVWNNIPMNLSSQEIERLIYQKFNLIFFYFEELDQFFLMPYSYDGGLDYYGRPTVVYPVPIAASEDAKKTEGYKRQESILRMKKLKVIYDVQLEEDFIDGKTGEFDIDKMKDLVNNSCVIIRDYTPQFSENGIARVSLQDSLLDAMADCVPFSRTAMLNSTGVNGVGVQSDDEAAAVWGFSNTLNSAALAGKKLIPIKKKLDLQELTAAPTSKVEEFMQTMQSYNNLRLSMYGLDNNGLYDKKAYVNNMQSGVNNVGLSLQDGLSQRQNSCNIINSIWGIGFWCDINEVVSGADMNADGLSYNEQDQSGETNNTPTNTEGSNE